MKKMLIILCILGILSIPLIIADEDDWYLFETLNITSNVTNPQSMDFAGAFTVLDFDGTSYLGVVITTAGRAVRADNLTYVSKASAISYYNNTAILVTNISSIYFKANSSNYAANLSDFPMGPWCPNASGHNLCEGSNLTDTTIRGVCSNHTNSWFADTRDDIIYKVVLNTSGLYNLSAIDISATATNVTDLDCRGGGEYFYLLEDHMLHILDSTGASTQALNLTNLTGEASGFQGVGVDESGTDLYVVNNVTNHIYHLMQFHGRVFYKPTVVINTPSERLTEVNTAADSYFLLVNWTASSPYNASEVRNDLDNCSLLVNGTINSTHITVINLLNVTQSQVLNVTLQPGDYTYDIKCCSNHTFGGCRKAGRQNINIRTHKHIFWFSDQFALFYNDDTDTLVWNSSGNYSALEHNMSLVKGRPYHLTLFWDNSTGNRTILINGAQVAADNNGYLRSRTTRFYLGSRNHSGFPYKGQLEGVIDYFRISKDLSTAVYSVEPWSDTWVTPVKEFFPKDWLSHWYQFKVILSRAINTELPVVKRVNISYKTDLFNYSSPVEFLDFPFTSGTQDLVPAGQSISSPIYNITNYGNSTINLTARSSSAFSSCFTVKLYNQSLNATAILVTLSTTAQTIEHYLKPGDFKGVWLNVSASGCLPGSEAFDIIFDTVS